MSTKANTAPQLKMVLMKNYMITSYTPTSVAHNVIRRNIDRTLFMSVHQDCCETTQRFKRGRELKNHLSSEREHRNTQQNDSKPNTGIHFKNSNDEFRFITDIQGWLKSHQCNNVIHHINQPGNKLNMNKTKNSHHSPLIIPGTMFIKIQK